MLKDNPATGAGTAATIGAVLGGGAGLLAGLGMLAIPFAKRREDRKVSRELVEVVRQIPAEEAIIIFTFKPRGRQVNMAEVLKGDLAGRRDRAWARTLKAKPAAGG